MPKILVVDDDDDAKAGMEKKLKRQGYDVLSASNAGEAVKSINANNFDVVVADMVMEHDKAGLDVLKAAKEKNESIKVVIITAYRNILTATAFELGQMGIFALIEKDDENPFDVLCAKVKEALEKIESQKFDVFLCHNSEDKPRVKEIGMKLKEKDIRVWLDEWELPPGRPWQPEFERQFRNIKSAAVFVGRSGVGPWQKQEIDAFIREFVNRECPVIPVILRGCKKPELPIFLKGMTWVDFNKKNPDPMQQLIWGITHKKEG